MSPITNYIKERIAFLQNFPKNISDDDCYARIRELQDVLSKIQELDKICADKICKAIDTFGKEFVETNWRSVLGQELNK